MVHTKLHDDNIRTILVLSHDEEERYQVINRCLNLCVKKGMLMNDYKITKISLAYSNYDFWSYDCHHMNLEDKKLILIDYDSRKGIETNHTFTYSVFIQEREMLLELIEKVKYLDCILFCIKDSKNINKNDLQTWNIIRSVNLMFNKSTVLIKGNENAMKRAMILFGPCKILYDDRKTMFCQQLDNFLNEIINNKKSTNESFKANKLKHMNSSCTIV